MNIPSFDFAHPPKRSRRPILGWVAILLVIGMLTAQQFAGYMERGADSETPSVPSIDSRLKMIVKSSSLESAILKSAGASEEAKKARKEPRDSTKRELRELASEIKPHRRADGAFALLYSAIQYELGAKPDPADLDALAKEKGPRRRAAARIYAADALDATEAKELARPFADEFFADKLVKIHIREKAGDFDYRAKALQKGAIGMALSVTALLAAGLSGLVLLFAYLGMRSSGRWKPIGHPAGALDDVEADANAMRTALMLVGLFGGQVVVAIALGGTVLPRELKTLIAFGVSIAFSVYVVRSPVHGASLTLAQIGIKKGELGKDLLWGIGAALANLPILVVAALIGNALFSWLPPAHHPIQDELTGARSPYMIAALVFSAAVFAPIFEEATFRGVFLPALSRRFRGAFGGIVSCGIAFAIIHPTGVPAWLPLAAIGIMAAQLTYQRGSIVPAIVMHAFHNGAILAFSLIALA